jgi:Fe-S-cluster-containing hydrogenase component 2
LTQLRLPHAFAPSGFQAKVSPEACNGCGGCARRCPYGNILIIKETDASGQEKQRVVKCDMCVDFPRVACVYNCPVAAAHVLRPEEIIAQHKESRPADER